MSLFHVISLVLSLSSASEIIPGLEYFPARTCQIGKQTLTFQEIHRASGAPGIEFTALRNSKVDVTSGACRYQGPTLPELVQEWSSSQTILAATNGNLFGWYDPASSPFYGWRSKGLIWTKAERFLAPLRLAPGVNGGSDLIVFDEPGVHLLQVKSLCEEGDVKCASSLDLDQFEKDLLKRYPTMTLALQLNMPLYQPELLQCPAGDSSNWKCKSAPRTVLCVKADASVSLLTFRTTTPYPMARALAENSGCNIDCKFSFNLDGGGSTQQGHLENGQWLMTQGKQGGGCPEYRPVEHYLAFTQSKN